MTTAAPKRIEAMRSQLSQASDEYTDAKEQFDAARVTYEVAREKFASVRRLAISILSTEDWWKWRREHPSVQYAGLRIGEAIKEVLEVHAYQVAMRYWESVAQKLHPTYKPTLSLDRIQETLERGGFEFRTAFPLREVNAGLINVSTVKKDKLGYKSGRADEILKQMEFVKDTEERKIEKAKAQIGATTPDLERRAGTPVPDTPVDLGVIATLEL